ncbi:hypothetical protein C8F01DRAFT_1158900 [Mycena amicta]|nr:hypothetical protein C8F01DRAFT_1158900 [Mycena amicta]
MSTSLHPDYKGVIDALEALVNSVSLTEDNQPENNIVIQSGPRIGRLRGMLRSANDRWLIKSHQTTLIYQGIEQFFAEYQSICVLLAAFQLECNHFDDVDKKDPAPDYEVLGPREAASEAGRQYLSRIESAVSEHKRLHQKTRDLVQTKAELKEKLYTSYTDLLNIRQKIEELFDTL